MKRAAAPVLAPALLTLPEMMRLGYRMSFLALEFQLTLAARLWGLTRKVQAEATAIAADLPAPMEAMLAPLTVANAASADVLPAADTTSIAAPAPGPAPASAATPGSDAAPAPAAAARRARRRAADQAAEVGVS